MAVVYILYSKTLDKYYVGSCKDLTDRLNQHLDKEFQNAFTSKTQDWEIYYCIEDLVYLQARKIENHIKSMKSRKFIENLKKYPEIVLKLKSRFNSEDWTLALPIAIGMVQSIPTKSREGHWFEPSTFHIAHHSIAAFYHCTGVKRRGAFLFLIAVVDVFTSINCFDCRDWCFSPTPAIRA